MSEVGQMILYFLWSYT